MNNNEKIKEMLKIIDDVLNDCDKMTVMLEMLSVYVQFYGDDYPDFWKLVDFLENIMQKHIELSNYIKKFHNILVED